MNGLNKTIEEAKLAVSKGQMVVVCDDELREAEGDLMIAADMVTPEAINFMASYGKGLICLAMDDNNIDRLGLPQMVEGGECPLGTAFTISVDARHGVSTGISAADRARTIQVAADPTSRRGDLVAPGHVFPLRARAGGLLERQGHTEAAVDLASLAGHSPSGVICEIINEDGTMARGQDLRRFASHHGLPVVSVDDLVNYRQFTDKTSYYHVA
ncbi:MAG: 3,4-dihydroxy-2-butanone-4-phosphate synthase [Rubrobacter sp.]|nr:3,4-dihydroxy-2-butanone-4-phosphate synthase [Rubrobacter sp.]